MSKKDIVMDSAIKLFLKKGFADVSNSEIIKKSGVGSGTIYYYFEDKNDLIVSTIDKYILEMLHERLRIIKRFEGDSYSTLEHMFRQMIGCDAKNEPYTVPVDSEDYSFQSIILLACEGIQKYDAIRSKYNEFNYSFTNQIDKIIEKGKKDNEIREDISTQDLSYFIQSNINGIFFMSMIQDDMNLNYIIESNLKNIWDFIKK